MSQQHQVTIKLSLEMPMPLVQYILRAIVLLTLTLVIGSNSPKLMNSIIGEPSDPTPQIMQ